MGDTAIGFLRGVLAERPDKKCALRGQRIDLRQLYLSRREISPTSRLRANGGIGRTSDRLRSVIKRSRKPQGRKKRERRKVFRGAVSRRTIRPDKPTAADTFGQKEFGFLSRVLQNEPVREKFPDKRRINVKLRRGGSLSERRPFPGRMRVRTTNQFIDGGKKNVGTA